MARRCLKLSYWRKPVIVPDETVIDRKAAHDLTTSTFRRVVMRCLGKTSEETTIWNKFQTWLKNSIPFDYAYI